MILLFAGCADHAVLPETLVFTPIGTVVSGDVPLSVQAGDAAAVRFEVDGVEIAGMVAGEWATVWDTRRGDDGLRTVRAIAEDGRGGELAAEVEVWVSNHGAVEGDVAWVNPTTERAVCGDVPVEVAASKPITFSVDGGDRVVTTEAPHRWMLDTSGLAVGAHTLGVSWFAADGGRATLLRTIEVSSSEGCDAPPVVTFTAPGYDATLATTTTLSVEVSDDGGVVRVETWVDGEPLGTDDVAPYVLEWTGASGPHTLSATATDTSGQMTRTESHVVIDSVAPLVSLNGPGGTLSGAVSLDVEITEDHELDQAWLIVDGDPVEELSLGARSWAWDTTLVAAGAHVVEAVAIDRAGNTGIAALDVVVDNPPIVELLEPGSGPLGEDQVEVIARASDDVQVSAVTLSVGGTLLVEGDSATWDTCDVLPGAHVVHADAVDDAGQVASAAARVVVTRPPEVALVQPPTTLDAVTRVAAWLRSDHPIAAVTWDVDGVVIAASGQPRGGLPGPCALRCAERCVGWAGAFVGTSIPEGDHVVTVTLLDTAGASATASFTASSVHDADADGVAAEAFGGADCDDNDPDILPGATEECNGVDDDCDAAIDEDFDLDGDGAFDDLACPEGADCDDGDAQIGPDVAEACDGVDNNCDGAVDTSGPPSRLGFGGRDSSSSVLGAVAANVYEPDRTLTLRTVSVFVDPDGPADLVFVVYDKQSTAYIPIATSVAVAIDGGPAWYTSPTLDLTLDANEEYAIGVMRESVVEDWYGSFPSVRGGLTVLGGIRGEPDGDGVLVDAYSDALVLAQRLEVVLEHDRDGDGDGETRFCGDCDDGDATVHSGGVEICNSLDDDCSGQADDPFDLDLDGYGSCRECDDTDPAINPGMTEVCGDTVDDDCDGITPRCAPTTSEVPLSDADLAWSGLAGGDTAGAAVAAADLDGDGVAELLLGAPEADDAGSRSGAVYLISGPYAAGGTLSTSGTWTGEGAGDASGSSLAASVSTETGWSSLDLDGDGAGDVVVGAPGDDDGGSNAGAAYVLSATGGTFTTAAKLSGPDAYAGVGTAVTLGDLDGDGSGDIAAAGEDVVWVEPGSFGSSGTLSWLEIPAENAGDELGASLAAGDLDGDGVDDLLIGAPEWNGSGAVYVLDGPLVGGVLPRSGLSTSRWDGAGPGDATGTSLAFVGDVDGDGNGDVLVGAPGAAGGAGRAYLIPGPPTTDPVGHARAAFEGDTVGDALGAAVAGLGDVDGDGAFDVLVGAPGDDRGGLDAGVAWLLLSRASGAVVLGDTGVLYTGDAGAGAGDSLAGPGDVDADGYADVLIGGSGDDHAGWDAGAIWLFLELP